MNAFYIKTSGLDEVAIKNGLAWLVRECRCKKKAGIIATLQLQSIRNVLQNMNVPTDSINAFLESKVLKIEDVDIQLMTIRKPASLYHDGIGLVIHPTPQLLQIIDKMPALDTVLVIPWLIDECQEWLDQKHSTQYRSSQNGE